MFKKSYKPLREKFSIAKHNGIFRKQISLFEGVALIISGTIGAGVLSLPFAISKVGISIGIIYIVGIGILMMGLNLLLGSIAVRTKQKMQLIGFAGKYLGKTWKWFLTILLQFMLWGY